MKKWRIVLVVLIISVVTVVVTVVATGLTRVNINTDIFSLLPADSPTVEGLRLFQKNFGSAQTIVISIRTPDANTTKGVAETLVQKLQSAGLAEQVIWRSPFQNNTQGLAEFLAYLWFNQPANKFTAMAQRFDDTQVRETLQLSIETMSTSLNPQEVARLAYDPFSLTSIGNTISSSLMNTRKNPFASADGRLRILYVPYPGERPEFWKYRNWLKSVNQLINGLQQNDAAARQSTIHITGSPVFVTEFGSRLLQDVTMAAISTLIMIAALFWWAHRRWAPLLWLMLLLIFTVAFTVALSGFLFGSLNAISLGFAAILVGLAVDYAIILYQERHIHPEYNTKELRRLMAPSILWAAATTAGAFAMLARSSLPGLTQLGLLVAIGIVSAAIFMLTLYVTLIGRAEMPAAKDQAAQLQSNNQGIVNKHRVWSVTLMLLVLSALMLLFRSPGVQYGVAALKFDNVQARAALEEVQREITGFGSELWLIVRGVDEREVGSFLENAEKVLSRAKQQGIVIRSAMPTQLWPQIDAQQENRDSARALVQRSSAVRMAAEEAGFTPDSLQLTTAIFDVWQRFADSKAVAWPKQPASRWLFSQFSANDHGQVVALGQIEVTPGTGKEQLQRLEDELTAAHGGQLVGWSLLADSLVETMKQDARRVMLPIVVALVLMLALAYRDVREIALSFATLGFTLICLAAAMGAFNWSWNLMNMTAIPLLLGAGVDYSIHIQLALKRYAGNIRRVKRSVGNAILLCGASTAAAFASLGFASNPGLASLGRVVALGIVIATLTAVFLLPVWWSSVHGHNRLKDVGETQ